MNKPFFKFKKLSKFHWIAISVIAISFFTYYGITTYISMSNKEEPRWMECGDGKKTLYLKFHKTDKFIWDRKKTKWVKSKNKYFRDAVPTLEMHENKSDYDYSNLQWKLRQIYQSGKYYVFYQKTGGFSLWGTAPKEMAQHIIINREDLSLLYYENEWIINKAKNRYYDDEEIERLFDEAEGYPSFYENIKLLNGKILKGERSLNVFQCREIAEIKPKI